MGNQNTDKVKQLFGPKAGEKADLRQGSLAIWAEEFLDHYLRDGLGVMSKKETEVLVMSLLERHAELDGKTSHELSLLFQQPETRVATLRYEAKLRYPPDEKEYVQ